MKRFRISILACIMSLFALMVRSQETPDSTLLLLPPHTFPDISQTIYPVNDSLTYDQYVGETIAGYTLADGWREDTLNGGYNKEIYWNPYVTLLDVDRFEKQCFEHSCDYFRYKQGKKYTGQIVDTLISHYTSDTVIFEAACVKGMVHGKGTLTLMKGNKLIAQCIFENGEIVGECISWEVGTGIESRVTYVKGSGQWEKYVMIDEDGTIISSRER